MSITANRKRFSYRILESALGVSSITFLVAILLLAWFYPIVLAVFIICYSLFWLLKFTTNIFYTVQTYKQLGRWQKIDWQLYLDNFSNYEFTKQFLIILKQKYKSKIDWKKQLQSDIGNYPIPWTTFLDMIT